MHYFYVSTFLFLCVLTSSTTVTIDVLPIPLPLQAVLLSSKSPQGDTNFTAELTTFTDIAKVRNLKGKAVVTEARNHRLEKAYFAAVRGDAKAVLVTHFDRNVDIPEVVSLGLLPVLGIYAGKADNLTMMLEGTVRVTIDFRGGARPGISLVLTLDRETDRQFQELIETMKELPDEIPLNVFYGVDFGYLSESQIKPTVIQGVASTNGTNIETELVRQKCVFLLRGSTGLLTYISAWLSANQTDISASNARGLAGVNLSEKEVETCLQTNKTTFLTEARTELAQLRLTAPGLLISGYPYYGKVDKSSLRQAFCSSFRTLKCDNRSSEGRELDEISGLCSPGCHPDFLLDKKCHPECDNLQCDYGKWTCRCSLHCTTDLLNNHECDLPCNTTYCSYDKAQCLPQTAVSPNVDGSEVREGNPNYRFEDSKVEAYVTCIGLILAFCLISGILGAIVLLRRWRANRVIHVRIPSRSINDPNEVILNVNKVRFRPELVDFELKSCMICLNEFQRHEGVVKTLCRHLFHFHCLKEWLNLHVYCPICMRHPFDGAGDDVIGTENLLQSDKAERS